MIGHTLVTKQTGLHGRPVRRVYVEAGCDIARELYLSLLVDRVSGRVTIVASTEGGMEIEEVAAKHPEKILRVGVDPPLLRFGLGLDGTVYFVRRRGRFVGACFEKGHFQRQADDRWIYRRYCGLKATVIIPSIGCKLRLEDVYDRVVFGKRAINPARRPSGRDES